MPSDEKEDFNSLFDDSLEGALNELGASVIGEVEQFVDDKKLLDPLLRSLTSKKELDRKEVIDMTMKRVVESIQAQAISLLVLENDGNIHFKHVYYSKLLYAGSDQLKSAYEGKAEELKSISFPKGTGIAGKVIESGETYVAFDAQNDPNFYAGVDNDTGFVTKSMITVALKVREKDGYDVFGAIQVLNKEGGSEFSNIDVGMLEEVASYSSKAIKKIFFPDTEFTANELAKYKARLTRNEFIDLDSDDFEHDTKLLELIEPEIWNRYVFLPIEKEGQSIIAVAMANPLDFQKRQDFEIKTDYKVGTVYVAPEEKIQAKLKEIFGGGSTDIDIGEAVESVGQEYGTSTETVEKVDVDRNANEDSAPIIKLSNRIIEDAYVKGASDIHVEPFEKYVLVRYRIDGMCKKILELPRDIVKPLISRFKIMGELDIAERRRPQSGRIVFKKFTSTNINIDLRIEVAPMNHGEKACMRILDKTKSTLPLPKLGFSESNLTKYREAIKVPFGMILHVGPTGSGKSMTLYSALGERYSPELNIHTAEDPIEYTLEGINQMQMRPKAGVTFASALRSFLRMDPDIILVGEIRDRETADIAVEAALTGHLLFSTLHTNDAAGTVVRFTEMGVEPFMISGSMVCVCAQRLMRKLCTECRQAYEPTEREAELLELDTYKTDTIFKANPKGCDKCSNIGYKGRVGTHELMVINDALRDAINADATSDRLKEVAIQEGGMISLHKDTMEKVRQGITDIEEALRVVQPD